MDKETLIEDIQSILLFIALVILCFIIFYSLVGLGYIISILLSFPEDFKWWFGVFTWCALGIGLELKKIGDEKKL